MATKRVLILEDDRDLAYTYEQIFVLMSDHQVVLAHSLFSLQSRKQDALSCEVAILDIDLGANEPSGVDAYLWLRDEGFKGRIYFLTGHGRSNPLVKQAVGLGATLLTKPVPIDIFLKVILGNN